MVDSKLLNNKLLLALLIIGLIIGGFVLTEGLFEKKEAIDLYDHGLTLGGNLLVEGSGSNMNYSSGMISYGLINDTKVDKIIKAEDVNQTFLLYSIDSGINLPINSSFVKKPTISSVDADDISVLGLSFKKGTSFKADNDVIVGDKLANALNLDVGSNLTLHGKNYSVCGIAGGNNYTDYTVMLTNGEFIHKFVGNDTSNVPRIAVVKLNDGVFDLNSVKSEINSAGGGKIHAITSIQDEWYAVDFNSPIASLVPCVEFIVAILGLIFVFIVNLYFWGKGLGYLKKQWDDRKEVNSLVDSKSIYSYDSDDSKSESSKSKDSKSKGSKSEGSKFKDSDIKNNLNSSKNTSKSSNSSSSNDESLNNNENINFNSFLIKIIVYPIIGAIIGIILAIALRYSNGLETIYFKRVFESIVILIIIVLIGSIYSISNVLKLKFDEK